MFCDPAVGPRTASCGDPPPAAESISMPPIGLRAPWHWRVGANCERTHGQDGRWSAGRLHRSNCNQSATTDAFDRGTLPGWRRPLKPLPTSRVRSRTSTACIETATPGCCGHFAASCAIRRRPRNAPRRRSCVPFGRGRGGALTLRPRPGYTGSPSTPPPPIDAGRGFGPWGTRFGTSAGRLRQPHRRIPPAQRSSSAPCGASRPSRPRRSFCATTTATATARSLQRLGLRRARSPRGWQLPSNICAASSVPTGSAWDLMSTSRPSRVVNPAG
jgi:hypothetical protein